MTCTEVATLHLHPDLNGDLSSTKHDELAKLVARQPGCESFWVGRTVEDEGKKDLVWLIIWESYQAHKAFIDTAEYKPFVDDLLKLCAPPASEPHRGSIELFHYPFPTSALLSILSSSTWPICEFYEFDVTPSASLSDFHKLFSSFTDALEAKGNLTLCFEAAREDERHMALIIGWESVQHHLDTKKEEWFQATGPATEPYSNDPRLKHLKFTRMEA